MGDVLEALLQEGLLQIITQTLRESHSENLDFITLRLVGCLASHSFSCNTLMSTSHDFMVAFSLKLESSSNSILWQELNVLQNLMLSADCCTALCSAGIINSITSRLLKEICLLKRNEKDSEDPNHPSEVEKSSCSIDSSVPKLQNADSASKRMRVSSFLSEPGSFSARIQHFLHAKLSPHSHQAPLHVQDLLQSITNSFFPQSTADDPELSSCDSDSSESEDSEEENSVCLAERLLSAMESAAFRCRPSALAGLDTRRILHDLDSIKQYCSEIHPTLLPAIFRLIVLFKACAHSTMQQGHQPSLNDLPAPSHERGWSYFRDEWWETKPVLFRGDAEGDSKEISAGDAIRHFLQMSTLLQISSLQSVDSVMQQLLPRCHGCPAPPSDEQDPISLIQYLGGGLGGPMVYSQDLSLLKTEVMSAGRQSSLRLQHHFGKFQAEDMDSPRAVSVRDCEDAFKAGYSIALRALHLRVAEVLAVSDSLALLFGQASVGANLYLTPESSQGLQCHYDDHCVFVCQLSGQKTWRTAEGAQTFVVRRGDVLYIPRGWLHEAESSDSQLQASLHITFGVEVEPMFEWSGFLHVALNHSLQKDTTFRESFPPEVVGLYSLLFHLAIDDCALRIPELRRSCLVGSWCGQPSDGHGMALLGRSMIGLVRKHTFCGVLLTKAEDFMSGKVERSATWMQHWCDAMGWQTGVPESEMLTSIIRSNKESESQRTYTHFAQWVSNFEHSIDFESSCADYLSVLTTFQAVRSMMARIIVESWVKISPDAQN